MKPYFVIYFTVAVISLQTFVNAQSVSLGGADSFSVLASSTVTNTGATFVTGNVGVSPGTAITGFPPGTIVTGAMFTGAASLAGQARIDATTAYNTIMALTPTIDLTGLDLGGRTLTPGVYKFDTSAQLTGVLTLNTGGNPNAPFYFQIGSTLTTAAASAIITAGLGGATDKNIFFEVGSSATLGLNSAFVGNILAQSNITLTTGASLQGRALSINGAVALDTNNVSNALFLTGGPGVVAVAPTTTLITLVVVELPGNTLVVVPIQDSFQDVPGLTPNEEAVARALDKLASRDPNAPLIANLDTINRALLAARYDLLSPAQFAAIFDGGFATAQLESGNIERRLENIRDESANDDASASAPVDSHGTLSAPDAKDGKRVIDEAGKIVLDAAPNRRWGFYITGTGEWGDIGSTSNASGSNFTTGGVTVGADYRLTDHLAIGLTAGYENTTFDELDHGGTARNNGDANAYGTWYGHGFYLNGIIGGGYSSYTTKRESIGGFARGNPDGGDYTGTIGAGYEYRKDGWTIGPIAAVQYTTVNLNGFTEHGSLAPLHIGDQSGSSLLSQVGFRASYAWKVGRAVVTPEVRAQWLHEFQDSSQSIGSSFAENSAASFNVDGPRIGRDSLLLDVGVSVQLSRRTSIFAYYTGNLGAENYTSNSVNGGLRIDF